MELREVMNPSVPSHSISKKSTTSEDRSFQNLMNQKAGIRTPARHENEAGPWTKQKQEGNAVGPKELFGAKRDGVSEVARLSKEERITSGQKPSQERLSVDELEKEVKAEIADAKAEGTKAVASESKEVTKEIEVEAEKPVSSNADAAVLLASVLGASETVEVVETETKDVVDSQIAVPSVEVEKAGNLEEVAALAVADTTEHVVTVQTAVASMEDKRSDRQVTNGSDVRWDWKSEKVLELLDIRPEQVDAEIEIGLTEEKLVLPDELKESFSKGVQTNGEFVEKTENAALNQAQPRLYPAIEVSKDEPTFEDVVGLKADVVVQPRSEVQVHFEQMISNVARPVMTQVTEAVRANFSTLAGGQVVEIQLNPEQLGKVELKLHIHKGVIEAEIKVENQQVKSAIESSMAELKQSLSQRGYEVKDVSVNVDSDGHREGSQNGRGQQQSEDAEGAGFVELLEEEARKAKE